MISLTNTPGDSYNEIVSYKLVFGGGLSLIDINKNDIIYSIEVQKKINKISRATIKIYAGNTNLNTFDESSNSSYQPGGEVEIKLGYSQQNKTVFKGIIHKQKISILDGYKKNKSKSLLVLECVDEAIKLTNSYTNEIFTDMSDNDIIDNIISENGVSGGVEDFSLGSFSSSSFEHEIFPKHNSNDWNFILRRANLSGMVVINSDNSVKVTSPYSSMATSLTAVQTIKNGAGTLSFTAEINSENQFNSVEFKSWDPFEEEEINSSASEPNLNVPGSISQSTLKSINSPSSNTIFFSQPLSSNELKKLSDSKTKEVRLSSHSGFCVVKGVNNVELASIVNLDGFGETIDGLVYISGVKNKLVEGIYTTELEFGIKKSFFTNNLLIDKNQIIDKVFGVHFAEVVELQGDPNSKNRVKVKIPFLKNSDDGGVWATLSNFYTTLGEESSGGSFFYPEIGTQVIVSFVSGDPRFPVILGSTFTKNVKPYKEDSIDDSNNIKAIVTRENLMVEFDDEVKKITIQTSENNSIIISEDEESQGISITDINENKIITSKDEGIKVITTNSDISIESAMAITIKSKQDLTLESEGNIVLNGNNIECNAKSKFSADGSSGTDISSSGALTIKGSTVAIN